MARNDDDAPSGFSVVKDSIRRDREALFGATRQAIPAIETGGGDGDDSDGGSSSDGELPIFFTTTEADAEPTPTPLKTRYNNNNNNNNLAPAPASVPSPARAATREGGDDELAAFERAAAEALHREEQRSAKLVADHLTGGGCGGGRGGGFVAEEEQEDGNDDDDDEDYDESTDVRARRRPASRPASSQQPRQQPPQQQQRQPQGRWQPPASSAATQPPPPPPPRKLQITELTMPPEDEDEVTGGAGGGGGGATPANVSNAVDALYTGWLSGAAGRLTGSTPRGGGGGGGGAGGGEGVLEEEPAFDLADVEVWGESGRPCVEAEFVAATAQHTLDDDGNLPSEVAAEMPAPSVTLDLDRSLGGIDLDALLARLSTPEGMAELEADRAANGGGGDGDGDDALMLHSASDSSDGEGEETLVTAGAAAGGWVREQQRGGRGRPLSAKPVTSAWGASSASAAPTSALSREEVASYHMQQQQQQRGRGRGGRGGAAPGGGGGGGAGAPRQPGAALDPYGRGTRRNRPQPLATNTAVSSAPGAPPGEGGEPLQPLPFSSRSVGAPEPTVRINAWETMDPEAAAAAGIRVVRPTAMDVDGGDGGGGGTVAGNGGSSSSDDDSVDEEMEEWRAARMRARPGSAAPLAPQQKQKRAHDNDGNKGGGSNAAAAAAESAASRASAAAKQAMAAAERATAAAEAREAVISEAASKASREEEAKRRMEEENQRRAEAAAKAAEVRRTREAEDAAAAAMDAEAEAEAARRAEEEAKVAAARAAQDVALGEERRLAGNILFRKGDYQGAVEAYSAALSRHSGDAAALANRAAALLQLGDAAAAEADATSCLYIDPGHDKARHRRAQARRKLGDAAGALTDLEELRRRLPHHTGVAKDLAEARRLVAHADPGADAAAMEAHARERREAAARDEAAWEAKRDAGVKAHRDKQQQQHSKTAAAANAHANDAAAASGEDENAKRAKRTTAEGGGAGGGGGGGGGGDTTGWTEVIEKHHPGRSIVHPLATFSSRRLGAVPAAVKALAGGAPLPPPPPPTAFTLSLDVSEGGAASVATALEWAFSSSKGKGGGDFTVVAVALVTEDATPGEVIKGDAPMLGSERRALLIAAEGGGGAAGAAAARLAMDQGAASKARAEAGWDRLQADPALFMGQPGGSTVGGGGKGPDPAAEFAVGVFDGDFSAAATAGAAGAAAVAACRRAAEEGLDVVAMRSVLAMDPDQARVLASFSPHRIGVVEVFGAGTGAGGATLAMAVRGRKAVARWRSAVGADLTPQVAALTDPDCLRAALDANVMSVSLSAATAKREVAFLFGGRVTPGTPAPPPGMKPGKFVAAWNGAPSVMDAAPKCVSPQPLETAWVLLPAPAASGVGAAGAGGRSRERPPVESLGATLSLLGTRGFYVVRVARVPAGGVAEVPGASEGTLAICVEAEGARAHLAASSSVAALSAVAPGARAVLDVTARKALVTSLGAATKDTPSPGDAVDAVEKAERTALAAAGSRNADAGVVDGGGGSVEDADAAIPADAARVSCLVFGGGDIAAAGGELIAAFKELGDPALLGVRLVPRLASSHVEGLKVGPPPGVGGGKTKTSSARGVGGSRGGGGGGGGGTAAEAMRDAALVRGPLLVVAARGVGLLNGGGAAAVASTLSRMSHVSSAEGVSSEGFLLGASRDAAAARRLLAATFTERDLVAPSPSPAASIDNDVARFEQPLRRPLLPALLAPPPFLSAAAAVPGEGVTGGALEHLLLRSHRAGFHLAGLELTQPPSGFTRHLVQHPEKSGDGEGGKSAGTVVAAHMRRVDGVRKLLDVVGLPVGGGGGGGSGNTGGGGGGGGGGKGIRAAPSLAASEAAVAAVFDGGEAAGSAAAADEASFGFGLGPKGGHDVKGGSLRQLGCVVLPLGAAARSAPMPALASVLGALRGEGFALVGLRLVGQAAGGHGRELPPRVSQQLAGQCKGVAAAAAAGAGGAAKGFVVVAVTRDNAISRLGMMQRQAAAAAAAVTAGGGGGGAGMGMLSARGGGGGAGAALEGTAAAVFAAAHVSASPAAGCKEAAYLFEKLHGLEEQQQHK